MSQCAPFFTLLEGDDDPYRHLAQADPDDVEYYSERDTFLDRIDVLHRLLIVVLPLVVEISAEHAHEVGRGTDVGLVVELIHKLWLWLHFRVGDRVPPVIHHDQDKRTDNRRHEENECEEPANLFILQVHVNDKGRYYEQLEIDSQIPTLCYSDMLPIQSSSPSRMHHDPRSYR